jgi:uncharacterized protein (TIGR02117 family)
MPILRRTLRILLKTVLAFILLIALYLLIASGMGRVPVNSDFRNCEKDSVVIYLRTNGVHTDIVLPIENEIKKWPAFVNPIDTRSANSNFRYVSFGWGDKGFYLQTPEWSDLTCKTAFKALFFLSTTAMHVSFQERILENENCRRIYVSRESYGKLVSYIEKSFQTRQNAPLKISGAAYWDNDAFYEANGTYNLFFTCNTWTNTALKEAGLKACLWTPFQGDIMRLYRE